MLKQGCGLKVFMTLWMLFVSAFAGVGIYMAWDQQHRLTAFRTVEVTVLSKAVKSNRDSEGDTSYTPEVKYKYQATFIPEGQAEFNPQRRTFSCDNVLPTSLSIGGSSGQEWARQTIEQFTVGQEVTAYYNPEDPSDAYLLRQCSFFPYFFILFPTIMLILGGVGFASGSGRRHHAKQDARRKNRTARLAGLAWLGAGLLICGHYFFLAGWDYDMFAVPVTTGYMALGLLMTLPYIGLPKWIRTPMVCGAAGAFLGFVGGLFIGLGMQSVSSTVGGPVWCLHGTAAGATLFILLYLLHALRKWLKGRGKDGSR